jgi:hypothetical protein
LKIKLGDLVQLRQDKPFAVVMMEDA